MSYAARRSDRLDLNRFRRLAALVLFALPAIAVSQTGPEPGSAPLCTTDEHTLCLNDNRFAVTASFQQTPSGISVQATAVTLTADTGYFWFFDPANIEIVTKVLNGCGITGTYWVFAAGLTNVGVSLVVRDMQFGGLTRTYENPVGTAFVPIQDTDAFHSCP